MNVTTIILSFAALNVVAALYIIWALGKRGSKKSPAKPILLDTCALIDGRVVEIAKSGFINQPVVVPQFVIAELQYLADHGDSHKRERARFGLDVVRDLQQLDSISVDIAREEIADIKEVDDKLIALAKLRGGMLYTTDYNLNKVARIEGVIVLNVNELSHALRPHYLPGEQIEIKITGVGQEQTQGVGYLEDGTMVVVENAGRKVGQKLLVECSRILQTQAGKMMFATVVNKPGSSVPTPNVKNQPDKWIKKPNKSRFVQKPDNIRPQQAAASSASTKIQPRDSRVNKQRSQPSTPEDALLAAVRKQNQ